MLGKKFSWMLLSSLYELEPGLWSQSPSNLDGWSWSQKSLDGGARA